MAFPRRLALRISRGLQFPDAIARSNEHVPGSRQVRLVAGRAVPRNSCPVKHDFRYNPFKWRDDSRSNHACSSVQKWAWPRLRSNEDFVKAQIAMPTHTKEEDRADMKLRAARRALELVEPGMTLGLGSGTTATLWIKLLGERVRDHGLQIRAIATSEDSEHLGRSYGIPFVNFEECPSLDLTIDGADEIAPRLALIKGGGGKLLREKIVASASKRFVVIADESKQVEKLGRFPLPVEVIQMAAPLVSGSLRELGFTPTIRVNPDGTRYITDEGNLILDCSGLSIENPAEIAAKLDSTVGIVEHGLFLGMATLALIASDQRVIERSV
jgi:ribose 5-phosphate isomerase A